jgi:hypothetical protein
VATGGTLNLFSQIGIIMLVGLAAKNGILIVEFANQLRDAGRRVRDAVLEAASLRLRPILMTSIATVMGRDAAGDGERAGIGQSRHDRRGRRLRRDLVDLPVAVRGAGVLPVAGAVYAFARGEDARARETRT